MKIKIKLLNKLILGMKYLNKILKAKWITSLIENINLIKLYMIYKNAAKSCLDCIVNN